MQVFRDGSVYYINKSDWLPKFSQGSDPVKLIWDTAVVLNVKD